MDSKSVCTLCTSLLFFLPMSVSLTGLNFTYESLGCLEDRCYHLIPGRYARSGMPGQYCRLIDENSYLAKIPDEKTNTFLTSQLSRHNTVWTLIGATNIKTAWQWTTGDLFEGNITVAPDCINTCGYVQVTDIGENFNGTICSAQKNTICRTSGQPLSAEDLYISFAPTSWFFAREICRKRGQALLYVQNDELDALRSILRFSVAKQFWVGLYTRKWIWLKDGTELTYTHFYTGSPITCDPLLFLNPHGQWKSGYFNDLNKEHTLLCETDKDTSGGKVTKKDPSFDPSTLTGRDAMILYIVIPIACVLGLLLTVVIGLFLYARISPPRNKQSKEIKLPDLPPQNNPEIESDNRSTINEPTYLEIIGDDDSHYEIVRRSSGYEQIS